MKDTRKDLPAKLLNKLNHRFQPGMLCFLSDEKKSATIRLDYSIPTGCISIDENQAPSSPHGILNGHKRCPLYASINLPR